jgi:hypothetical protein
MALTVTRQGGICTTFLLGAGHACAALWQRARPAPQRRRHDPNPEARSEAAA